MRSGFFVIKSEDAMGKAKKNIVVIGGGTGTSVVLQGLKKYPVNLSAIITTGDDGSSSGVLRRKFRMIPPGDIRQCLIALASGDFGYLNERFELGFLRGHTLGNLFITLFAQKSNDFQKAIDELLRLTNAQGSIIPVTLKPITLIANLKDGRKIRGEKNITPSHELQAMLDTMTIFPVDIPANPRAKMAIGEADVIVVGPGNLFSSILPNLLVRGVSEAIRKSKARKIYIANLFTQPGHTDNFTVLEFVRVLSSYIGEDVFDHVIYNNRFPDSFLKGGASAIMGAPVVRGISAKSDGRFIGRSVASLKRREASASDPIARIRNPFLHDPAKLASAIWETIQS